MTFSQDLATRTNFRATSRRRRSQHDLPTNVQARVERDDPRPDFANFDRI